jgi:hypothetical protein
VFVTCERDEMLNIRFRRIRRNFRCGVLPRDVQRCECAEISPIGISAENYRGSRHHTVSLLGYVRGGGVLAIEARQARPLRPSDSSAFLPDQSQLLHRCVALIERREITHEADSLLQIVALKAQPSSHKTNKN